MRDILSDGMPEAIKVNGILFELNTDFRVWLKTGKLLNKIRVAKDDEANEIFIEICDLVIRKYPEKGYVIGDELLAGLIDFYAGFPKEDNATTAKEKQDKTPKPPSFDFSFDASYIYCSFASFYGIRLQTVKYMHWWEFLTLFEGLMMSDQTSVNFVVGTRQQKIKPNMPKEEKARIQKLQKQFALPEDENTKTAKNKLTSILGGSLSKKPNPNSEEKSP